MAYTPPGVKVNELTTISITPQAAVPTVICLHGLAQGTIQKTEAITLNGTTATTLVGVPTGATQVSGSIVKIIHATTPELAPTGFAVTTDYTFSSSAHTITR